MTISFNQVPAGIRVPFLYAEFDNANAVQTAGVQPYKTLMIGQKLAAGTKAVNTKHLITSKEQAIEYFGEGSQLAKMAEAYLKANKSNELHCIPIDDAGAGVAALGSITVGGAPTAAGTFKLYVAGKVVEVAVSTADSAEDIAAEIAAVIEADDGFVISAEVDGVTAEKVNFTAKNKGTAGNDIDLRLNYFLGDELPAGVTGTIVAMASGATNPSVAAAIATLDDTQYMIWVTPYTDAANLLLIEEELTLRFGPTKQNDGYHITSARGTLSELNAIGDSRNSQFTIIKRCSGPSSPYEHASATAAVAGASAKIDPARPLQTLPLPGILGEESSEKFTLEERDILLNHGISTDNVDSGGVVRIERLITTYKKNPAGADDVSYLN